MSDLDHDSAVAHLSSLLPEADRALLADLIEEATRAHESAERRYKRLRLDFATVVEVAHQIHLRSLDLDLIQNYTLNMVMGQFAVLRAVILRRDGHRSTRIVPTFSKNVSLPDLSVPVDGPLAERLIQMARPVDLDGPEIGDLPEAAKLAAHGLQLCCPLVKSGRDEPLELMGILCLGERVRGESFGSTEFRLLGLLANLIAISLYNAQLYHRSIYDSLTGVHSRGYFDLALANEIERARRYRSPTGSAKPLCLVIADLDHFKTVNDTHGHLVGDEVLRNVARMALDSVRSTDVVARYGGEEFAIILPETDKAVARMVAERIRKRVDAYTLEADGQGSVHVTVSLGVAAHPWDANEAQDLLRHADRALYVAKTGGRNRTILTEDPPGMTNEPPAAQASRQA